MSERKRRCVSIFTDGSFFPDTGSGGWGAVVCTEGKQHKAGGAFKNSCSSPLEAELFAATNGLSFAVSRGLLQQQDLVILQIDSTDALAAILGSCPAYRQTASRHGRDVKKIVPWTRDLDRPPLHAIRRVHDEYSLLLMVRHVKGHVGVSGRHKINEIADALARDGAQG